ncbi:phosphoinositide 3-kinase regulatory subunit 6 [Pungitius pungitius]|uniref:phosphoinositide 3-kinase regulatory subunit 6 n=1 Tax=Pungitius pungitius TaxID=134920 RepID=UPI002E12FE48
MTSKTPRNNASSSCSMEPTAGCSPKVSEPDLYRSVMAVLPRETDPQHPQVCLNKGMLRWTLHKKVQSNPVNGSSLVWVLIKELEKAERWDSRKSIIPLLHTLMYAIIQTAYIPDELYKRVYSFCKRLLTYPQPYCTVGLSYTRQIKTERSTPGLMYQRMVTAEQRLKNEHYPLQERVFILADPEVFSRSLEQVVRGDIETSSFFAGGSPSPIQHMCSVVQHSIQAALGAEQCHGPKLARALKDMGQDVESHFHEVLAALEQSAEEAGRGAAGALRSRLQRLYSRIVSEADSETLSSGELCNSPLPNPEMSFYVWTEDLDIWRVLAKWFRSGSLSEQFPVSQEQEDFDLGDSPGDLMPPDLTPSDKKRSSVLSDDSGIGKDLPPGADPSPSSSQDCAGLSAAWEQCKIEPDSVRLSRRNGLKMKPSVKDSMALMQDTLQENASFRAGGGGGGGGTQRRGATLQRRAGSCATQNPFLKPQRHFTARIVAMGDDMVLGRLAKAYYSFSSGEICGAMISLNYRKVTLSGRDVDKGISVRTSGAQITAIPCNEAEDLNCLTMTLNESPTRNQNNNVGSTFRSSNLKIRTLEGRPLTVTLDRDRRRIYTDVQSLEISPCLDPGYCVQKTIRFKSGVGKEAGLSKYMNKGLPLPINTFAGIIT